MDIEGRWSKGSISPKVTLGVPTVSLDRTGQGSGTHDRRKEIGVKGSSHPQINRDGTRVGLRECPRTVIVR